MLLVTTRNQSQGIGLIQKNEISKKKYDCFIRSRSASWQRPTLTSDVEQMLLLRSIRLYSRSFAGMLWLIFPYSIGQGIILPRSHNSPPLFTPPHPSSPHPIPGLTTSHPLPPKPVGLCILWYECLVLTKNITNAKSVAMENEPYEREKVESILRHLSLPVLH